MACHGHKGSSDIQGAEYRLNQIYLRCLDHNTVHILAFISIKSEQNKHYNEDSALLAAFDNSTVIGIGS